MNFNNGHSCGSPDKTIINRIMQRFRPIAPKPVTEGPYVASVAAEIVSTGTGKKKRKYVRVKKNDKPKFSEGEGKGDRDRTFYGYGYVDAFLSAPSPRGLSGSSERGSFTVWSFTAEQPATYAYPTAKSVDDQILKYSVKKLSDLDDQGTPTRKVVESWVVVDGMTETCHDVAELGNSDTERMRNLEMDTCPGLISDGDHRVQWINHAYQQMVVEIDQKEVEAVVVNLVLREKIPDTCHVFTCTVRVMYNKHSQTMPCDVWRMDFGGFAWRLDATAALKLGR